jgi:hypothetical protein
MLLLKIVLLPFVVLAMVFLVMVTHVAGTTLHHRFAWTPVSAVVLRSETLCEVTYQPRDGVLRAVAALGSCEETGSVVLPEGGTKPRTIEGVHGALVYSIDGAAQTWEGKLSDAGIYKASAGDSILLYYDPSSPQEIDTAQYKGWLGGLLIFGFSAGTIAFYGWLVRPCRKGPADSGGKPRDAGGKPGASPPHIGKGRPRQRFGRA